MKAIITLVGGQTLPNLLPIKLYQPDVVLLVHTERTISEKQRLKRTLEADNISVFAEQVNAYNIVEIMQTLQNCLNNEEFQGIEVAVNLTGGTKAMSSAMLLIAQLRQYSMFYLESERGNSHFYEYVWDRGKLRKKIDFVLEDLYPTTVVTIEEWLNLHYGSGAWKVIPPSPTTSGARFEIAIQNSLTPLVHECIAGVRSLDDQVDLDVVIRVRNQFAVIEAKAGTTGRKLDGVKQLNNARQVLGTYTKLFRAITVQPEPRHTAILEATRIKDIIMDDYRIENTTLSVKDETTLINRIKQEFGL